MVDSFTIFVWLAFSSTYNLLPFLGQQALEMMKSLLNEFIIIAGNNDRSHVMESADGLALLNIQPPRILIVFLRNA
jgi:hypothetical protein